MIQVKGNTEGAFVEINGDMNTSDMLVEAVGAVLAIVGAIANAEGEVIARSFAKAVIKSLNDDEVVACCIAQGIEAGKNGRS